MAYETTDQLLAEISDHWVKDHRGNLYKLFDIYNSGMEQISDIGNKVVEWRAIDNARGSTLDLFGQEIDISRPTQDDDPYRFMIKLKTLLSRAQGTIPSIVHITSTALGTDQGIKIWNTAEPRHIGIQIPWNYVSNDYVQRFLLQSMQHMLALGYWLDCIVFRTTEPLTLHMGMAGQEKTHDISRTKIKWWSGYKTRNTANLYLGTHGLYKDVTHEHHGIKWWTGWKAKNDSKLYFAITGRMIKTSLYHTKTKWWTGTSVEVHTGPTIGNKLTTTTTQSLTSE